MTLCPATVTRIPSVLIRSHQSAARRSAASAGRLSDSVSDSTSENLAQTEAQAGQPIREGLGQPLQERYAQGVINARPTARWAAAQAQRTSKGNKKRKYLQTEIIETFREQGVDLPSDVALDDSVWEETIFRLRAMQDREALKSWYHTVQQTRDKEKAGTASETSITWRTMSKVPYRGTAAHGTVFCGSDSPGPPLEETPNELLMVKIP